jgi:hypothetical protein
MALLLGGFGSILLNEIGKVAMNVAPDLVGIAKGAVVEVAKNTFDNVLDANPKFANFLGHFGVHRFKPKYTFTSRERGRSMLVY